MKIKELIPNEENPRLIYGDRMDKLMNSIKDFPAMMELRPIIIDEKNVILGGNMRFRAIEKLGMKTIPDAWVKKASELTEEQKKEFIIKDNVQFGEWEMDDLANTWETDLLEEWGMKLPNLENINKVNGANEEWVGMPEFDAADNPFKIVINFDSEEDREEFQKKYEFKFTKQEAKAWSTWYPWRGRDDLQSLKYEEEEQK